jgi:hypothetical protein
LDKTELFFVAAKNEKTQPLQSEATQGPEAQFLTYGHSVRLRPERSLWLDEKHRMAVLAMLALPRYNNRDFAARFLVGRSLDDDLSQLMLAHADTTNTPTHEPVYLEPYTRRFVFGRNGLTMQTAPTYAMTDPTTISYVPFYHQSMELILRQVGAFTSREHIEGQLNADGSIVLTDISRFGTVVLADDIPD